ncbi:POK8 protein, partial [Cephalopterus ornatus]|nr:POK8 protein [Cephalopterus ornatus]
IEHLTGIPHSPTGQAGIERAHCTLKEMLQRQKRGSTGLTPQECLNKALYIPNFLNRIVNLSPAQCHFIPAHVSTDRKAEVIFKDPTSREWQSPYPLI